MGSFEEKPASVPDPVLELARKTFGIVSLTPWQRFAVANTLEGVNQLVVFPTGGGKSVCFQLPGLLLDGVTLIVVPLLSLLKDQERRLKEAGVGCEVLRGGQDRSEREGVFQRLAGRTSRLVFAVPEILENQAVVRALKAVGVGHFVVDEAHCVSEWGKTFRPAYLALAESLKALACPLVSGYTATASPEIVRDIETHLFQDRPWTLVQDTPDRPNIFYRAVPALSKNEALFRLVSESEKPLVVFVRSRQSAERSSRMLRRRLGSEEVYFYHAGLERLERRRVEDWFFGSAAGVLCATSAYGMGIDKPDIRTIIHREVPPSIEAYLQESGRAGRDGRPAAALLLYGWDDERFAETIASPVERARYDLMRGYIGAETKCRRRFLLNALGHEAVACAGCDLCAGTSLPRVLGADGFKQIAAVLKTAPRRYTKRELVALLQGRETQEALHRGLPARRGFGLLAAWEREDIEEALEILEAEGLIKAPPRGFFRRRYRLAHRYFYSKRSTGSLRK